MFSRNPIMLKGGLAPATDVAEALGKSLSTIHRMVADGRVDGSRDGRALYINLTSLEAYYAADDNPAMAAIAAKLRVAVIKEANAAASAEKAK